MGLKVADRGFVRYQGCIHDFVISNTRSNMDLSIRARIFLTTSKLRILCDNKSTVGLALEKSYEVRHHFINK